MAQQNDTTSGAPAVLATVASPDLTLDDVAIFSVPALEVVFEWWRESNRRWTERKDRDDLVLPETVTSEAP